MHTLGRLFRRVQRVSCSQHLTMRTTTARFDDRYYPSTSTSLLAVQMSSPLRSFSSVSGSSSMLRRQERDNARRQGHPSIPTQRGDLYLTQSGHPMLTQMLAGNHINDAWRLFYDMLASGEIYVGDCNIMLKACYGSEQQRALIEVTMRDHNITPNVITYHTLLRTLRMEGDDVAARDVMDVDMVQAGLEPDEVVHETMEYSSAGTTLSRLRTSKLSQYLNHGSDDAIAASWSLINKLVERQLANEFHFNVMLMFCTDSQQQRELINVTMEKAHVKADVYTYTTLLAQLKMEGDDVAAQRVMDVDVVNAGLESNEVMHETMGYSSTGATLSRMRTSKLARLSKQGGEQATAAAWSFMDKLVEREVANLFQFTTMMNFCSNSHQQRKMMDESMKQANLKPTVIAYTTLLRTLRIEGDDHNAHRVMQIEMVKDGVTPDEVLKRVMNGPLTSFHLMKQRTKKLTELLKQGKRGELAAEQLCRAMHTNGVANKTHLQIMIDSFVNQDPLWKVDAHSGALMWYNMGKGKNSTSIPQKDGMHMIDLHNCTRGVAAVKLIDHLLHLRSEWMSSDCEDSSVMSVAVVVVAVGKKEEQLGSKPHDAIAVPALKGAATRLLTRLNITAEVDASNSGRLIIDNKMLLKWFQSEQAKEWNGNLIQ